MEGTVGEGVLDPLLEDRTASPEPLSAFRLTDVLRGRFKPRLAESQPWHVDIRFLPEFLFRHFRCHSPELAFVYARITAQHRILESTLRNDRADERDVGISSGHDLLQLLRIEQPERVIGGPADTITLRITPVVNRTHVDAHP